MNYKIYEHDLTTNEEIERPATNEEIAELETRKAQEVERLSNEQVKASARLALLERLGLTEDEAKLLLS